MQILQYAAEQFAGVRDQRIDFSPGINVVLGENETGKSTMIAAIFHALTTSSRVNKRTGKEFIARFFPSNDGNAIDTKLEFSIDDSVFLLKKIWDKENISDSQCILKEKDGAVWRGASAEQKLQELLPYGAAAYSNLIFGRQSHEDEILAWCYDFFNNQKNTDIETVRNQITRAFSAAGGISEEKFLAILHTKMEALVNRWDVRRNAPEKDRDIDNPWARRGTILEAYYSYRIAERACQEAEQVEEKTANLTNRLAQLEKEKITLETQWEELLSQKGAIQNRDKTQRLLTEAEQSLQTLRRVSADWSKRLRESEQGKALTAMWEEYQTRQNKNSLTQKIQRFSALQAEIDELQTSIAQYTDLPNDKQQAERLFSRLERNQNRLNAAKLQIKIQLQESYVAQISDADGTVKTISGSFETVAGFVQLSIPNVGQIQAAPEGIDIEALQQQILQDKTTLQIILDKYQTASVQELSNRMNALQQLTYMARQKETEKQFLLQNETINILQERADAYIVHPDIQLPETLETDIRQFLRAAGKPTLESILAVHESTVQSYIDAYGSLSLLKAQYDRKQKEAEQYRRQLANLPDALSSTDYQYRAMLLKKQRENLDQQQQETLRQLGQIDALETADSPSMQSEVERLKQLWELEIKKYKGYQQIEQDFNQLCSQTEDKLSAFYQTLNHYLATLSGETLSMQSENGLIIQSGNNKIPIKELLSEGARKTVLLAFRLAALTYFFPNGNGMIVLDDDLLDMDTIRRTYAATLLQEFAQNHQVIFTTCDPSVANLLGGKRIELRR